MEPNEISYCSKSAFPWEDNPFQLWSLLDMLKIGAEAYIWIGKALRDIEIQLYNLGISEDPLTGHDRENLLKFLSSLKSHCDKFQLKVSSVLLTNAIWGLSNKSASHALEERGRIRGIIDSIFAELKVHLFLFVASDRAQYYEQSLPEELTKSFPASSKELTRAGNCYAVDEYTACVFHCMRGVELGLRSLAKHLNVPFQDLELEPWKNIIDQIEKEIKAKQEEMKRGPAKTEELKFLSDAASQFRYFKDAYRNHVAHARSTYDDGEAERIMRGTREFLQSLSTKLKE